jgi:chromate transporter
MNFELLGNLYLIFIKLGVFTFGGGYAMIPLFHEELVYRHELLSPSLFGDIVAIAQITPGPIGINAATFAGYMHGTLIGAAVCTLGLLTPSLIIVSIIVHFTARFKGSKIVKAIMSGIRPAVIGFIFAAVMFFAEMSIFTSQIPLHYIWDKISGVAATAPDFALRWEGLLIFVIALICSGKLKINIIWTLLLSAILGVILI